MNFKLKYFRAIAAIVITVGFVFGQAGSAVLAYDASNSPYRTMSSKIPDSNQIPSAKDDFYEHVNAEWLDSMRKSGKRGSTDSFMEVTEELGQIQNDMMMEAVKDKSKYPVGTDAYKMVTFYENYLNQDMKNQQGYSAIRAAIQKIRNAATVDELTDFALDAMPSYSLLTYEACINPYDYSKITVMVDAAPLTIGRPQYYVYPEKYPQDIMEEERNMAIQLLVFTGESLQSAQKRIDSLMEFEKKLAPYLLTENYSTVVKRMNVMTLDEFDDKLPNISFGKRLAKMGVPNNQPVVSKNLRVIQELNKFYSKDYLPQLKTWLEVTNLMEAMPYLGDDFISLYSQSSLSGNLAPPTERDAVEFTYKYFWMVLDKQYTEKYLPSNAKKMILDMSKDIVDAYKVRVKDLNWMTSATKAKALDKLDKLKVIAVAPDEPMDLSELVIRSYSEGGSICENYFEVIDFFGKSFLDSLGKPTSEAYNFYLSNATGFTTSAVYWSNQNQVVIPAGILNDPFFNAENSYEENMAGIGFIVAHEVSHAFDEVGANYDSYGRLENWWTDTDRAQFDQLLKQISGFYDNITFDGTKVNGEQLVGEVLADLNAMALVLDLMGKRQDINYDRFFRKYASNWKHYVSNTNYYRGFLADSAHPINKMRVNLLLPQFEKFNQTYGITKNNKIYIPTQQRLRPFNLNPSIKTTS